MAYAVVNDWKRDADWSPSARHVALVAGELTWTFLLSPSPSSAIAARRSGDSRGAASVADGGKTVPGALADRPYPSLRMMRPRKTASTL